MVGERALWNWEVCSNTRIKSSWKKVSYQRETTKWSNARRFSKLYKEQISKAQKTNRDNVNRNLSALPRGRLLLLGSLDQIVQRFLLSIRRTGALVSSTLTIYAAKALIARNLQYSFSHIDLDSSHWAQSLFRRMGFKKQIQIRVKSRFQKVLGKRLNCYIFITSSRLLRNMKSLIH